MSQRAKTNTKKYWFKRKLYGWGWTPVTWQGWLITLLLIGWLFWVANNFLANDKVLEYVLSLIGALLIVIAIAYKKGEKPRWQWGRKK